MDPGEGGQQCGPPLEGRVLVLGVKGDTTVE